MLKPGDVVIGPLAGVVATKTRPLVVVSTDQYHAARPDVIVAVLTTQIARATATTDYVLKDWSAASLHRATAFRLFLATVPAAMLKLRGHLSDRDWQEIQTRLRLGIAVT
jgi:mRNA interferase MazF